MNLATHFIGIVTVVLVRVAHHAHGTGFRIIGGQETNITSYPYMVSLENDTSLLCGGAIVNRRFIVTAAQCVSQFRGVIPISESELKVRVGSDWSLKGGREYRVEQVVVHEDFRKQKGSVRADIAVVKVAHDIFFSDKVRSINISREMLSNQDYVFLTGYGTRAQENTFLDCDGGRDRNYDDLMDDTTSTTTTFTTSGTTSMTTTTTSDTTSATSTSTTGTTPPTTSTADTTSNTTSSTTSDTTSATTSTTDTSPTTSSTTSTATTDNPTITTIEYTSTSTATPPTTSTPIYPTDGGHLAVARLEFVNYLKCSKLLSSVTVENVCAGYGENNPCMGDTGSPLVSEKLELLGVASWSKGCTSVGIPSVFTNVVLYRPWVAEKSCLCLDVIQ